MIIAIIPAHLESTRLQRKLLLSDSGKPLIQHTYEAALASRVDAAYVATGDHEIAMAVRAFGGNVLQTTGCHRNGTGRVVEAARQISGWSTGAIDYVINVQGDEAAILPGTINRLVDHCHLDYFQSSVVTVAVPFDTQSEHLSPNAVKVVCDRDGRAIYFSRAPIPYRVDNEEPYWLSGAGSLRHVGIYAFSHRFIDLINGQKTFSVIAEAEQLEQLRWLYLGHEITVLVEPFGSKAINTRSDYDSFLACLFRPRKMSLSCQPKTT